MSKKQYEEKDNFNVMISILMIVIGLVLMVWPGHVMTSVLTILGIALLAGGGISILSWRKNGNERVGALRLAEAIVMVAVGLAILIKPKFFISIIPTVIGVVVVFNGILNLAQALELKRGGYENWTSTMILAVVTLALGLVVLFNPFSTMELFVIAIGAVILYNGASNLWIESRCRKIL